MDDKEFYHEVISLGLSLGLTENEIADLLERFYKI
jgi:hypothetical protein